MRGEARPEVRVVTCKLLTEEDSGHGTALLVRRGVEEVAEFQGETVGIGLLAEVEECLSL